MRIFIKALASITVAPLAWLFIVFFMSDPVCRAIAAVSGFTDFCIYYSQYGPAVGRSVYGFWYDVPVIVGVGVFVVLYGALLWVIWKYK